jgi:hypothetical protein
MLDPTDAKQRAAAIADRYIPATDRGVTTTDNQPPEPIADETAIKAYAEANMAFNPAIDAAVEQTKLVRDYIAGNPVIQTAEEAQTAGTWIESTRRTIAALEDERKPKVEPLNAALNRINGAYKPVREQLEGTPKSKGLLGIIVDRANAWADAERRRREAIAAEAKREAEAAAARAQALIDQANDAIAAAEVGACEDVGTAVIDAQAAIKEANKLDRTANRADRETAIRLASSLGGRTLAPRRSPPIIVIDDPVAAIKAIGLTEKITLAIQQSAKAFKEAHGELPAGTRETFTSSF